MLVQLFQALVGILQTFLGIGNHLTVDPQLLVDVDNLGMEQGNFLVDCIFLIHQCLDFAGIGIILGTNGFNLCLYLGVFNL